MQLHLRATGRTVLGPLLGLVLTAVAGCAREPSRSAVEDAVSADLRQQLAQLGSSPLAQLSGESQALKDLAADEQLRVRVADQKCDPIGEDKYRCDVLLDLQDAGALPDPAGASQKQAVYVLTKLGGRWRAREEPR